MIAVKEWLMEISITISDTHESSLVLPCIKFGEIDQLVASKPGGKRSSEGYTDQSLQHLGSKKTAAEVTRNFHLAENGMSTLPSVQYEWPEEKLHGGQTGDYQTI